MAEEEMMDWLKLSTSEQPGMAGGVRDAKADTQRAEEVRQPVVI